MTKSNSKIKKRNIESALDEADKAAKTNSKRLTHDQVFSNFKKQKKR